MNHHQSLQGTRDFEEGNPPHYPPTSSSVLTRRHVSFQDDERKESNLTEIKEEDEEEDEEDPTEGFESMERAIMNSPIMPMPSSSRQLTTTTSMPVPPPPPPPPSSTTTTLPPPPNQRSSINSTTTTTTTSSIDPPSVVGSVGSEHLSSEKIPKNSFLVTFLRDYIFPNTTTQKRKLIHILYLMICIMVLFMFSFLVESRKIMTFAAPYHDVASSSSFRPAVSTVVEDTSSSSSSTTINEITKEVAQNEANLTPEQQVRINTFRSILSPSISTAASLSIHTTPQYRALQWLSIQDERNIAIPSFNDSFQLAKVKQRYILALFYYSTGGEGWKQDFNFLSGRDECEWNGMVEDGSQYTGGVGGCDSNLLIQTIALWKNNLDGQLPMELGELSSVKVMSLYSNKLWGSLPANFAKMTSLKTLYLHDNELTGDLGFMCTTTTSPATSATSWITNFRSDCFGTVPMVHCPCCNVCCARDANGEDQCYTQ